MWLNFVTCVLVVAQGPGPDVDADQFLRVMDGKLSELESVHFTFEGQRKFTGPAGLVDDPKRYEMSFQGTYAFRSDGASLLDSYIYGLSAERPVVHETLALLKGRLESVTRVPDLKHSATASVENGGPGSLSAKPGSPESIIYLWYFKTLRNLGGLDYEFLGWEDVEGHNCLNVQIGRHRLVKDANRKAECRYWIDLARGGHPLKVENYMGGRLTSRIDKIHLEQIPTRDQQLVWLPVSGEIASFCWKRDEYYDSPVMVETAQVLRSTARVSESLPDAIFTLRGGTGAFESAQLRQSRLAFEKLKPPPRRRADAEGVKQDLDRRLAEADGQAKQLEASSAARQASFWTPASQLAFAALGAVFLVGALVVRRRR